MNGNKLIIGVDTKGAENGVNAVIDAVKQVLKLDLDVEFVLYGVKTEIDKVFHDDMRVESIESKDDIPMDYKNVLTACMRKPHSSMALGLKDLGQNKTSAFVSNGSTGALMAGAAHPKILGRLTKNNSLALTASLPQRDGSDTLFLDVGADNRGTKAESSLQNTIMAVEYVRRVKGIQKPVIGYGSIGTEEKKGKDVDVEAFKEIENYFGDEAELRRLEPNLYLNSGCDIIVTSGIRGNFKLKMGEGVFAEVAYSVRESLTSKQGTLLERVKRGLGAYLLKDDLKGAFMKYDPRLRGGAVCLGIDGIVVKSHGGAQADANSSAILQAIEYARAQQEHNILGKTRVALDALKEQKNTEAA